MIVAKISLLYELKTNRETHSRLLRKGISSSERANSVPFSTPYNGFSHSELPPLPSDELSYSY